VPTIRRERIEIYYEDVGDGRPVLFIPGWSMTHELWDRQVTAFSGERRCVIVDLRGHGWSSKPASGYSYDDHVADLVALVDALGLDELSIVGSSFGGSVGVMLANRLGGRARQVVTVGSPPRVIAAEDFPAGRPEQAARQLLEDERRDREVTMRRVTADSVHADVGEAMLAWLLGLALRMPTWAAIGTYAGVLASDVRADVEALGVPLLATQGRHDRFVSVEAAEWMAEHAPKGRLELLDGSGHFPFLEEPEAFNAFLAAFLAEGD